jgi:hypothetical protein
MKLIIETLVTRYWLWHTGEAIMFTLVSGEA